MDGTGTKLFSVEVTHQHDKISLMVDGPGALDWQQDFVNDKFVLLRVFGGFGKRLFKERKTMKTFIDLARRTAKKKLSKGIF